jgi:uncharacterized protein YgiM (DUF1202 family)
MVPLLSMSVAFAANFPFIGRIQVSNALNVRSSAKMDAEVLGRIKAGEKVVVMEEDGEFYKVQYPKQLQTWLASWLLLGNGASEKDVISRNEVNVRSGPGMHFPVVARLVKGSDVQVLEINKDKWARIGVPTDAMAWVASKYVVKEETLVAHGERVKKENRAMATYDRAVTSFKSHLQSKSMTEEEYLALKGDFQSIVVDAPKSVQALKARDWQLKLSEFRGVLRLEELRQEEEKKLHDRELQIAEEHRQKLEQLKKEKEEPVRNYEFEGWLDDVGGILFRPATHRLKKGNDVLMYIKSKNLQLDDYVGKYVGLNGSVQRFRGWGKILDVKSIDVLHERRSSFWTEE